MAEKTVPSNPQHNEGDVELGRVRLAPDVLEVIIGIAVTDVEGVAYTRGSFASGVAEKFGKVDHGKGVKTEWTNGGLIVDVYCVIQYGFPIPAVALEVQKQIREALMHMTALETEEVNVHITGIDFQS